MQYFLKQSDSSSATLFKWTLGRVFVEIDFQLHCRLLNDKNYILMQEAKNLQRSALVMINVASRYSTKAANDFSWITAFSRFKMPPHRVQQSKYKGKFLQGMSTIWKVWRIGGDSQFNIWRRTSSHVEIRKQLISLHDTGECLRHIKRFFLINIKETCRFSHSLTH